MREVSSYRMVPGRYVSSRTRDNQSLRAMEGGNLNTYVDMGSHRVNNLALVKPDIF